MAVVVAHMVEVLAVGAVAGNLQHQIDRDLNQQRNTFVRPYSIFGVLVRGRMGQRKCYSGVQ